MKFENNISIDIPDSDDINNGIHKERTIELYFKVENKLIKQTI